MTADTGTAGYNEWLRYFHFTLRSALVSLALITGIATRLSHSK